MGPVELERVRQVRCRPGDGVVIGLDESPGFMLGGSSTVIEVHTGGGGDSGTPESFRGFSSGHGCRPFSNDRVDGVEVGGPVEGGEFSSDVAYERLPLLVVLDADGKPFIFSLGPVESLGAVGW